MSLLNDLNQLKTKNEAPEWMSLKAFSILSKSGMLKGETPKSMYNRIALSSAKALGKPFLAEKFFDYMWKNWMCPATPVLTNIGTDRGLPISCFGINIPDSVKGISNGLVEMSMLSKNGGGVGINFSDIRCSNSPIKGGANGTSHGVIPFAKMYDSVISGINQGSARRGAAKITLDIDHGDAEAFMRMRRPEGDHNLQCPNIHHSMSVSDEFMLKVINGDAIARHKWTELMKNRMETGEPYIFFTDNVNKANPPAYVNNKLKVRFSNLCHEITLFADEFHTYICCLLSLNAMRYDEWKNSDLPEVAVYMLNGVLNEFIQKASFIYGLDKAVNSAVKGRAIGIGVLGWHSLLQSKMLPFGSFQSMMLNNEMFKFIKESAMVGTMKLAEELGEPEWCKGTGMYNSHLLAIAPTRTNSDISGSDNNCESYGIEPYIANVSNNKSANGTFFFKNKYLQNVLSSYNMDTDDVWKQISRDNGSVQSLKFLTPEEKQVFLTAYEINQMDIIKQAAQRQKYICQSQSLNLFFPVDVKPSYFNDVHIEAWKSGIKTLYYCRSMSGLKADISNRSVSDCSSCEA